MSTKPFEISATNSVTNLKRRTCGNEKIFWKSDPSTVAKDPSFGQSTGHFIPTECSESLGAYLRDNGDESMFLLLDAPGTGKTTTIRRGAEDNHCLYALFTGDCGILSSAKSRIRFLLEQAAAADGGCVTYKQAEAIGISMWTVAFVRVLEIVSSHLAAKPNAHIGEVPNSGVDWTDMNEDMLSHHVAVAKGKLMKVVGESWNGAQTVVLHFDEIQALLQSEVVENHRLDGPISVKQAMNYILVWFSQALKAIGGGSFFKPCISGISVVANTLLRIDGGMKIYEAAPLPYFGEEYVKQLLSHYVDIQDGAVLTQLACGCEGSPRTTQFVLRTLHSAARKGLRDMSVADILEDAYKRWTSYGHGSFLNGYSEHASVVAEFSLATMLPHCWGGQPCKIDGISAAEFNIADIPSHWLEAFRAGLLRLRVKGLQVHLFPAYPFLQRYHKDECRGNLKLEDQKKLVRYAHELSDTLSHVDCDVKAFNLAFALELCLPHSPAHKWLQEAMQDTLGDAQLSISPSAVTNTLQPFSKGSELTVPDDEASATYVWMPTDEETTASEAEEEEDRPCGIAHSISLLKKRARHATTQRDLLMIECKTSLAAAASDAIEYVSKGLRKFIKVSETAKHPYSCYVCNATPNADAKAELHAYNEKHKGKRAMGLLVLDETMHPDECILDVNAALHADPLSSSLTVETEWAKKLFRNKIHCQQLFKDLSEWYARAGATTDMVDDLSAGFVGKMTLVDNVATAGYDKDPVQLEVAVQWQTRARFIKCYAGASLSEVLTCAIAMLVGPQEVKNSAYYGLLVDAGEKTANYLHRLSAEKAAATHEHPWVLVCNRPSAW